MATHRLTETYCDFTPSPFQLNVLLNDWKHNIWLKAFLLPTQWKMCMLYTFYFKVSQSLLLNDNQLADLPEVPLVPPRIASQEL